MRTMASQTESENMTSLYNGGITPPVGRAVGHDASYQTKLT